MTGHRTRVAIVSPQPLVVAGIAAMLSRHPSRIKLVGPRVPSEPDIVLYDVMGLLDGDPTELDRLVDHAPAVVLAIGREGRADLLAQALVQGADGCIDISIGETVLLAALDAASTWRSLASTTDPVLCACPAALRAGRLGLVIGLSGREAAILTSIARGLSNAEIAHREFLSINTVKSHIRSAYNKIGVHTRSQAVRWVLQDGFDTRDEHE